MLCLVEDILNVDESVMVADSIIDDDLVVSGNFAKCLTYALLQAIGLPRHKRSRLSGGAFPILV